MRRLLAVLLCLSLRGEIASADADEATTNLAQFVNVAGVLQGFTPRGDLWRGQLTPGEATLIVETFMVGNEYLVLATGDASASDIDLELFDADLVLLEADFGEDATPLLTFSPTTSGTYTLRVTLAGATAPAAWYALQVMYR